MTNNHFNEETTKASLLSSLRLREGYTLRKKETFEYQTPHRIYDVELFEHADGTYHAIGIPRDTDKVVVYGSSVMSSAKYALQNLIDKITRDGVDVLFGGDEPSTDEDVYADDDDDEMDSDE